MSNIIRLPGLIDPHVHLRDPGQTEKEDFSTGTRAAIAGGFTTVLDMPNNQILIDSEKLLDEKRSIAEKKIVCDVGFYFGSLGTNVSEFPKIMDKVKGLKLFLNHTTGGYNIDQTTARAIFNAWPKNKLILVHAENEMLEFIVQTCKELRNKIHICHVSTKRDLQTIRTAKKEGLPITCGVTPHHLFLTESQTLVKPPIGKPEDQDFLWKHLNDIDVIESDHAPHTVEEKNSQTPPFGVPNLETTFPLLLTAVSQHKLALEDIKRLCFTNPAQIFTIAADEETYVEVDDSQYVIDNSKLFTKCKWSPYAGLEMKGKVIKTVIRGTTVFEHGKICVEPGFGKII